MRAGPRGARRGITALALSAGLVTTTAAVAQAEEPATLHGKERDHSVTLITGDRVELAGGRVVRYVPGPGRAKVPVRTYTENGHQHVVPADALQALALGKLDPRLFDVTSMVEFGYDDARRDTVPVIVRPVAGARSDVTALRTESTVPAARLVTGTVQKSGNAWESLRGGAVEKVWLDGVRKVSLDRSTKQIGAPEAWQAGITGRGCEGRRASTRVSTRHTRTCRARGRGEELHRVAGRHRRRSATARTSRRRSPVRASKYRGVAPDAELLDAKVCQPGGCRESAIIAGMQWAAEQGAAGGQHEPRRSDSADIDPIEEAVNRISRDTARCS